MNEVFKVKRINQLNLAPLWFNSWNDRGLVNVVVPPEEEDFVFHARKVEICPLVARLEIPEKSKMQVERKLEFLRKEVFPLIVPELNRVWGSEFEIEKMDLKCSNRIIDL